MISRRNHPVLRVSGHPMAEYVHSSLATIPKAFFVRRMRSLKPQTCIDTATIWGLIRHRHCPSRGAAPGRDAYLKGEVTNMFVVMATFLFQVRMYTGPGELVGTVRGEFTVADNTIQLARKSRTSTPPRDVCTMEKRWFS